jgi:tetratricopeptide (TPR) repeat protein
MGDYLSAAECCARSVELAPDVAMTHFNLGVARLRLGKTEIAIPSFRRAISLSPNMAAAHAELGNALVENGKTEEAIESYRQALLLDPGMAAVRLNLAKTLESLGNLDAASAECSFALAAAPVLTEAYAVLARILARSGKYKASVEQYRRWLDANPDDLGGLLGLAVGLREMGSITEAEGCARHACAMQPTSSDAHRVLGTVLRAADRASAAEDALRRAIALDPNSAESWNDLGVVLHEQGHTSETEAAYRQALACNPDQWPAYQNLSLELREQGRWQESLVTLDTWVERAINSGQARGERALVLLQLEDYARGWPEYEWRWSRDGMIRRNFGHPVWDGSDLSGQTVLVHAEQGIGDEIMFASCHPELIARADHVVVDCAARLEPLFRRSFPEATIFGTEQVPNPGWVAKAPRIDVKIPAGSVPRFLRRQIADFPGTSYLAADLSRVAHWRARFAALGTGLKAGISWRGGRGARAARCSTRITEWRELLKTAGVHWINLQYGVRADEIGEFQNMGVVLHHWDDSDPLRDLDDFAAQITALDLVISIDNATVHLAGALGKSVWILQPCCPDWRWGVSGQGHWYRSVRSFRQTQPRDWSSVFSAVRAELAGFSPDHGDFC